MHLNYGPDEIKGSPLGMLSFLSLKINRRKMEYRLTWAEWDVVLREQPGMFVGQNSSQAMTTWQNELMTMLATEQ